MIKSYLYNNFPGVWPAWTVAVQAVSQKDADNYVRAWYGALAFERGTKRAGVQSGGEVRADCGGTSAKAQEIISAEWAAFMAQDDD